MGDIRPKLNIREMVTAGLILGSLLVAVALLVTFTDICIPSMIYNFLFESKKD